MKVREGPETKGRSERRGNESVHRMGTRLLGFGHGPEHAIPQRDRSWVFDRNRRGAAGGNAHFIRRAVAVAVLRRAALACGQCQSQPTAQARQQRSRRSRLHRIVSGAERCGRSMSGRLRRVTRRPDIAAMLGYTIRSRPEPRACFSTSFTTKRRSSKPANGSWSSTARASFPANAKHSEDWPQ